MTENRFIRFMHGRPSHHRLLASLFFAGVAFILARRSATPSVQFMVTWIAFTLSSLISFWITIATVQPDKIKRIAKKQDNSHTFIFLFVVVASFISLLAILLLLQDLPGKNEAGHYYHIGFSIVSVVLSWVLIHSIFTFRYANLYYKCETEVGMHKEPVSGLAFPGDATPDYLDFAYFSFTIGMTFQVSDVQITSSHIRRLALLHGLLSFAYNTVIVALSINIISGLIQK